MGFHVWKWNLRCRCLRRCWEALGLNEPLPYQMIHPILFFDWGVWRGGDTPINILFPNPILLLPFCKTFSNGYFLLAAFRGSIWYDMRDICKQDSIASYMMLKMVLCERVLHAGGEMFSSWVSPSLLPSLVSVETRSGRYLSLGTLGGGLPMCTLGQCAVVLVYFISSCSS